MLTCPHCQSINIVKNGLTAYGKQHYRCHYCKRQSVERELAPTFSQEELLERLLLKDFITRHCPHPESEPGMGSQKS